MNGMSALLRSEARLYVRTAAAVVWVAALPLLALVVLGTIPGIREPAAVLHGISYLDAYLPILMAFSLCMSTINLLPPVLAQYRERGILKRFSTTPVPPWRLLAAQAVICGGAAVVVSVLLLAVAVLGYGVRLHGTLLGTALSLLLLALAGTGIGLLVAAVASSSKIANAMSMVLFFPLMFLAGLWVPRAQMPSGLRTASDLSPMGAGVRAVQDSVAGHWPAATSLLIMVGYAVVCGAAATRWFRWE